MKEREQPRYPIGARIKKFREDRGMSQRELADKIGVSGNRLWNWEHGDYRPDADLIADICRALNVSPSELLDVQLTEGDFTDKERKVIHAYRAKPELQNAVDILLGI